MENLPRDLIRLLGLDFCNREDAHYFAKTCKNFRRCFTSTELHSFQCGVVRDNMLRKRYLWASNPERWNKKIECKKCGVCMVEHIVDQKEKGSYYPGPIVRKYSNVEKHNHRCSKMSMSSEKCKWCNIRWDSPKHAEKCLLKPNSVCGRSATNFVTCKFTGLRAQVVYHQRRYCQLECQFCHKLFDKRRLNNHTNIISDRCDAFIYRCHECKQLIKGIDYADHSPCKSGSDLG